MENWVIFYLMMIVKQHQIMTCLYIKKRFYIYTHTYREMAATIIIEKINFYLEIYIKIVNKI